MVGKTAPITAQHRERFTLIKSYCGCLPCLLFGHPDRHTSIEHVTDRGRRIGTDSVQHEATIGLCAWHHFGYCDGGRQLAMMVSAYGPSLALGRLPFEETFGDERDVLIPTQDYLLGLFAEAPWPEYNLPRNIARQTRNFWIAANYGNTYHPQTIKAPGLDTL